MIWLFFVLIVFADFTVVTPYQHVGTLTSTEGDELSYDHQFGMRVSFVIPPEKLIYPDSPTKIKNGDTITVCKDTPVSISIDTYNNIKNIRSTVITNAETINSRCGGYSGSGKYGYGTWSSSQVCGDIIYGSSDDPMEGWDFIEFSGKIPHPRISIGGTPYSGSGATYSTTISSPTFIDMQADFSTLKSKISYTYVGGSVSKGWSVSGKNLNAHIAFQTVDPTNIPLSISLTPSSIIMDRSPYMFNLTIRNTGSESIQITSISSSDSRLNIDASTGQMLAPNEDISIPINVSSSSEDNFSARIIVHFKTNREICGEVLEGSESIPITYVFTPAPVPLPDLTPNVTYSRTNRVINVALKIKNIGQGNASGVYVKIQNNSPNSYMDTIPLGDIVSGGSKDVNLLYSCDNPDQVIDVSFIVDPDNKILESNENNNKEKLKIYCSLQCTFNPSNVSFTKNEQKRVELKCGESSCENVTWNNLNYFYVNYTNPIFQISPKVDIVNTRSETLEVISYRGDQQYRCSLPIDVEVKETLSECRKRI